MNGKLHTIRISVEIGSFNKEDLPNADEELINDVSGFFLERFENVTVKTAVEHAGPEPENSDRRAKPRNEGRKEQ